MKNTVHAMKDTLEGIGSGLKGIEEQISEMEDRVVEITAIKKKKEWKEMRTVREISGTTSNILIFTLQWSHKE